MPKPMPVGEICDQLHALARQQGIKSLAMWLKMAANEAYLHNVQREASLDERIGVFDWNVADNVAHLNEVGAAFFGGKSREALKGAPLERYVAVMVPHDVAQFRADLGHSMQNGGSFSSEYRVSFDSSVRWLRADGNCTLDDDGRPARVLGSLIDITREKAA